MENGELAVAGNYYTHGPCHNILRMQGACRDLCTFYGSWSDIRSHVRHYGEGYAKVRPSFVIPSSPKFLPTGLFGNQAFLRFVLQMYLVSLPEHTHS